MTLARIAIVAFIGTVVTVPFAIWAARKLRIVDMPGKLKPQSSAVPYLGGVAVLIGVVVGTATVHPSVFFALSLATLIGVLDDRFDLPTVVRLVGQIAVGVLVFATANLRIGGIAGLVLIVFVTILLVNGVNLLDGLDMLAAGVVAAGAIGFALLLEGGNRDIPVATAAALLGFLIFNRPPAKIYLGDGGSYLLGTICAVLLGTAWSPGVPTSRSIASFLFVAIAVAEVFFAVIRRGRGHGSILAGDRGHPYDRMVEMGWSRARASGAYIGSAIILAAAAVWAGRSGSMWVAVIVDCIGAALLVVGGLLSGGMSPTPIASS